MILWKPAVDVRFPLCVTLPQAELPTVADGSGDISPWVMRYIGRANAIYRVKAVRYICWRKWYCENPPLMSIAFINKLSIGGNALQVANLSRRLWWLSLYVTFTQAELPTVANGFQHQSPGDSPLNNSLQFFYLFFCYLIFYCIRFSYIILGGKQAKRLDKSL